MKKAVDFERVTKELEKNPVDPDVIVMMEAEAHRHTGLVWSEVSDLVLWPSTVDSVAQRLSEEFTRQKKVKLGKWEPKRHVLRAQALDVMCVSFPVGSPPSPALIKLMTLALGLPSDHVVGSWPIDAGTRDGRGGAKHEQRQRARKLDTDNIRKTGKPMSGRALAAKVKVAEKTVREWRKESDWPRDSAGK